MGEPGIRDGDTGMVTGAGTTSPIPAVDVTPRFKTERPWNCAKGVETCTRTAPCISCRNKRNRRKGKRGQANARKTLEQVTGLQASWFGKLANEETFDHLPVRVEVKAGRTNGANSVFGHYFKCENQAKAAKREGDARPFVAAFKPDGVADVMFVMRGSQLAAVIDALSGNAP